MAKRPDRHPTAEERELFRRAMADAEPLGDAAPRRDGETVDSQPPSGPVRMREMPVAMPRSEPPSRRPAPLEAGVPANLDRRTMDRLRKGRLRPEARIDLHGMTADTAHSALSGFLATAQAAGKRCVLVITGKGSLKQGGGVIRRELPAWLNAAGNRSRVLGFAQAQPTDGGGGAFYVLLKRKR